MCVCVCVADGEREMVNYTDKFGQRNFILWLKQNSDAVSAGFKKIQVCGRHTDKQRRTHRRRHRRRHRHRHRHRVVVFRFGSSSSGGLQPGFGGCTSSPHCGSCGTCYS